jgi:hypothetical protein
MRYINKIFILVVFFFIFNIIQARAEDPEGKNSGIVGTVKEQGSSWYAVIKTGRGEKKIYARGDIFFSDTDITDCLRVQDINEDGIVFKDVGSEKVFTVRSGDKIPLEGTNAIFEKSVESKIIEYRYNDTPGVKKGFIQDFTVKSLERKKLVVEKDYDAAYLPQGLSDEEKELFGSPKVPDENSGIIKADIFDDVIIEKIDNDTWVVNTERSDAAFSDAGKVIFSVIKGVEPRYRFGEGPSLKLNSELGNIVINKEGFFVRSLAVGKIVERAGIRQGDLIKKINGQPINSLYGIYRAYMDIRSDKKIKTVNMDIVRDGMPKTLTYKVR